MSVNFIWFDLVKFTILLAASGYLYSLYAGWKAKKLLDEDAKPPIKRAGAVAFFLIVTLFFQPFMLTPKEARQTIKRYDTITPVDIQEIQIRQPRVYEAPSNAESIDRITKQNETKTEEVE